MSTQEMLTLAVDLDYFDSSVPDPLARQGGASCSEVSSLKGEDEGLEEEGKIGEEEQTTEDESEMKRLGDSFKPCSRNCKTQKITLKDIYETSPLDLWSDKETSESRTLHSWDLPGGPVAWDDNDKPIERLLSYADLTLTEEEENGLLTDRIVAACSSYLTESPGSKCHIVAKVCLSSKNLNDIKILGYHRFLQYVDLSWNNLTDLTPLGCIPYLMYLDVSHNLLEDVLRFRPPTNLTYVNYSHNQVWQMNDLSDFWALSYLDLSHNKISKIQGLHDLRYLRHLDLSYNKIERFENLNYLRITDLNLEYNLISKFETEQGLGINTMPHLTNLYLNNNLITSLDFLEKVYHLKKLELQGNNISDLLEITHMKLLKDLRQLDMCGNPVSEKKPFRKLVLSHIPELRCLDGTTVEISEKVAANKNKFCLELEAARTNARMILLEQLNDTSLELDALPVDQGPYPFVIIVGPSASSKKNIVAALGEKYPDKIRVGRIHTTRQILEWEKKILIQMTREDFNEWIKAGKFLSVSEVLGQMYGFSRQELRNAVKEKKLCLTAMDMVAALTIHSYGIQPFLVLAVPQSKEVHVERLKKTYGPILSAIGATRIAHRKFADPRNKSTVSSIPPNPPSFFHSNVRTIELILSDVLDEVIQSSFAERSSEKFEPSNPEFSTLIDVDKESSEMNPLWPRVDPTLDSESESQKFVYYSTAKRCYECTPSKCGLQTAKAEPVIPTSSSARSERLSASEIDMKAESNSTSFSATQAPPIKVDLSSYDESSYGEDDPFANWSLPFIDWSEVNMDGKELEQMSEAMFKKFASKVMGTRDVYVNIHLDNPGLFSLTVYSDDSDHAVRSISSFLKEVWRSTPNRPPAFDIKKDLVYQAFVPRKLETLKKMLRNDFLSIDLDRDLPKDLPRITSATAMCREMREKGYGDSAENL